MSRTHEPGLHSWPEEGVDFRCHRPEDRGQLACVLERADALVLLNEYQAHPRAMTDVRSFGALVVVAHASGPRELAGVRLASRAPVVAGPDEVATALMQASSSFPPQVDLPTWDQCATHLAELCKEALATRGRS